MKIIEAMKQVKDLMRKAEDLRVAVALNAADLSNETPRYEDQQGKITSWLQAHRDLMQEILRLKTAIQRTNLVTPVTVELGGKPVTKTIAEWVYRRRELAALDFACWEALGKREKSLKEGTITQSDGVTKVDVRIRRYYNPTTKDEMLSMFKSEPLLIDAKLEVINAITDLLE